MKLNSPIVTAIAFADMLFTDQGKMYDQGVSYIKHCVETKAVLLRYDETGKDMLTAAILHDVMEDCEVSQLTIRDLFGDRVAELVWAVTDEPGVNRKERKAKTYPKIKATPGALMIKLADRIANLEAATKTGNERMLKMYAKEWDEMQKALRTFGELDEMWNHIANLLFPLPRVALP
jgi:(p)ppGpp synthase/HD superfamily hydrolase